MLPTAAEHRLLHTQTKISYPTTCREILARRNQQRKPTHLELPLPSPFGVLSTPPPPPSSPAVGATRAFAARFSFFKRGLGLWPASSSLPRSSLRLLCAPQVLPFEPDPEEPAEPPLGALGLSCNEGLLLPPAPEPLLPPLAPAPPARADDPAAPPAAVEAAAAAAAWARKTAGSLQNLSVLVPVRASILA